MFYICNRVAFVVVIELNLRNAAFYLNNMNRKEKDLYDAVIIGGSYAGLSAGMALGRAIRKVLIVDSGMPCNRQTPHSHNYLTRDGSTPSEIAAAAKADVLQYPTIELIQDLVVRVSIGDHAFELATAEGLVVHARKILFATGIKDTMPDIFDFDACWGISAIHCPYCHGYEYRDQPTGVLINGDHAFEFARLIRNWTDRLTVFTNGTSAIGAEHVKGLEQRNIKVVEKVISALIHKDGYINAISFADGTEEKVTALYAKLPFVQHTPLLADLGVVFSDSGHVSVNEFQKTAVPGVFAAGDNSIPMRSVSAAVAAGTKAGAMMNHELISEGH